MVKKYKRPIRLDLYKFMRRVILQQKRLNMLLRIQDTLIGMAAQGYTIPFKNIRTLVKWHKKYGLIPFKK